MNAGETVASISTDLPALAHLEQAVVNRIARTEKAMSFQYIARP